MGTALSAHVRQALLPALAALAAFLIVGTVASELTTPLLVTGDAEPAPGDAAPVVSGYAEAILNLMTMVRPAGAATNADAPDCVTIRTVKTTYRPVLLLNGSTGRCPTVEMMMLRLAADSREHVGVAYARVLVCDVETYTITATLGEDRLSGLDDVRCKDIPYFTKPGSIGTLTQAVLEAVVTADDIDEPGLKLACMGLLMDTRAGTRYDVQDLTWFEVWDAHDRSPSRQPHLQSEVGDTPCARIVDGFEMWE